MIQLERLLVDLRPPEPLIELETADPRLEEAAAAAVRGDYARAAQIAESIFASGVFDARLVGYLLHGTLLERGPAALEPVLRAAAQVVGGNRLAFTPAVRRNILLDGSLGWLLGKLVSQLNRAQKLDDELWRSYQAASQQGGLAGALPAAEQLQPLLAALVPRSRALGPLLQMIALLRELRVHCPGPESQASKDGPSKPPISAGATLEAKPQADTAPAATGPDATASAAVVPAAGSEPSVPPSKEDAPKKDAKAPQEAGDPGPTARATAAGASAAGKPTPASSPLLRAPEPPRPLPAGFVSPSAITASAELQQLARRIQQFAALAEQGQFLHAAVVADELQRAIDSFDPRVYLPALLAPYFRTLVRCSAKLVPILEQRDKLTFQALRQLYQVDPNAFPTAAPPPAQPPPPQAQDPQDALNDEDDEDD